MAYYSQQADGLCCPFTAICPKVPPSVIGLSYKDELEIERQFITLKKKIGEGEFGGIWEGLWNQSTPIIIEVYGKYSCQDGESLLDVKKLPDEIQILKKIQHKNILQFYAASTVTESTNAEPIYIITEFMNNASILLDYLRSHSGHLLKLPQVIDIGAQVASGMAYLEAQDYAHRDLAARSVLINEAVIIRIKLPLHSYRNEGTFLKIRWMAPEAVIHKKFSIKSDVWSFGILLLELMTYGRLPYSGVIISEILSKLQKGYRTPCPTRCPEPLYKIMLDCWEEDPNQRPSFEALQYRLGEYFVITADIGGYREPG